MAVVPSIVIGGQTGLRIAELALIAFIAVVGYIAARGIPVSRVGPALRGGRGGLTLVVIGVKNLAHY